MLGPVGTLSGPAPKTDSNAKSKPTIFLQVHIWKWSSLISSLDKVWIQIIYLILPSLPFSMFSTSYYLKVYETDFQIVYITNMYTYLYVKSVADFSVSPLWKAVLSRITELLSWRFFGAGNQIHFLITLKKISPTKLRTTSQFIHQPDN